MLVIDRKWYNRSIREALNLSLIELARRVEVSRQTVYNYEKGRGKILRPIERVIELELDKAIEECTDYRTKVMCENLRCRRDTNT